MQWFFYGVPSIVVDVFWREKKKQNDIITPQVADIIIESDCYKSILGRHTPIQSRI